MLITCCACDQTAGRMLQCLLHNTSFASIAEALAQGCPWGYLVGFVGNEALSASETTAELWDGRLRGGH